MTNTSLIRFLFKVCGPFLRWVLSFLMVELEESVIVYTCIVQNPRPYPLVGWIVFQKPMGSRDVISCDITLFFSSSKPP